MKFPITALALAGALALAAPASAETNRQAYGKLCQNQSKEQVEGQKGTPFSQCVKAMAKADKSESTSAREACKGMSKKHVKGEKGTPFSRCVVAAAKLKREQEGDESGD